MNLKDQASREKIFLIKTVMANATTRVKTVKEKAIVAEPDRAMEIAAAKGWETAMAAALAPQVEKDVEMVTSIGMVVLAKIIQQPHNLPNNFSCKDLQRFR
jgi:hypothetical protein